MSGPGAAASHPVWQIVFPGLTAADARTARLALIRLREGVAETDPLKHSPTLLLARDLPCSRAMATMVVVHLHRCGWVDEDGWPSAIDV